MSDEEQPDNDRLGRRAIRGAAVTLVAQATRICLQITSVVVLARLLGPEDYGLIAMVMAIIGFADIFRDFGLSSAAIQAPELSRAEQNNLFWINAGLGTTLGLLACAASPLIAAFYHQPKLVPVTMALSINFLLNGLATQYRADLNRRMQFRKLAVVDITAPAVGLVTAIGLALGGLGFGALVGQQLATVGVMLIGVAVAAGWLPGRYRRDVSVRSFLAFGWRLAGSQVLNYIGANVDTVVLGRTVGAQQLGLYNRAHQLVITPLVQVRAPLNSVAIPVLSRVQTQDERFQDYLVKGQALLGYSLVAGIGLVAGAASPLVSVLLGDDWLGATDVVRLLAIAGGFQTLAYVGYWVYVTKGLVGHLFKYTIFATGLRVVCVLVGSMYGLLGVAVAMALVPLLSWPISLWWLSRRAGIPVRRLWIGGSQIAVFAGLLGGLAGLAEHLSRELPSVAQLVITCGAWALGYLLLAWLVPLFRRDIGRSLNLVRTNLRRR